jgi:3-oxoadipate enol-lactonase/4-carboxymuconolactone decarboxylase
MIPVVTGVRMSGAENRAELPLLVLGPSLGTGADEMWSACAQHLTDAFDVLAWDLPGHGHNRAVPEDPFTMADLAEGVLALVADVQEQRGDSGASFAYAGVSVGGAVGLQLMLDHPQRVDSAVLIATGARILSRAIWAERIGRVSTSGTAVLVSEAADRWFAQGFVEREPDRGAALLHALHVADNRGYVLVCEALADFDVRDRLREIAQPVLAIAGALDPVTPIDLLSELARGVQHGEVVVVGSASHLAPAEKPEFVAHLMRKHFLDDDDPELVQPGAQAGPHSGLARDAGLAVRREVLGDGHVDRALANADDLTKEFQDFITSYAWGGVWTRPGLDRRSRSMVTLTALVAGGHDEELALHLRAARRNGLSWDEIKEVLLQSAIYCGVPAANTAFRIAQHVRADEEGEP